jgi:hypothetical protein
MKTQKDFIKKLSTVCGKSDIKPEIQGINVDGDTVTATDSYVLAHFEYKTNFTDGIYNMEDMKRINGKFPNHKQLLDMAELESEELTIKECFNLFNLTLPKEKIMSVIYVNYKTFLFDYKNIIKLLNIIEAYVYKNTNKKITINLFSKGMLQFKIDQNSYTIAMGRTK